jgi:hypothetical protein
MWFSCSPFARAYGTPPQRLVQVVALEKKSSTDATRNYTVFYEQKSVVDGRVYSREQLSGLECQLVCWAGFGNGAYRAGNEHHLFVGGRSGRSIFRFRIERSGAIYSAGTLEDARGLRSFLLSGAILAGECLH